MRRTDGQRVEGPVVTDIEIVGTDAVSEGAIKKKLATRETGWWPFAKKYRFDPVEWQVDLERIETVLRNPGLLPSRGGRLPSRWSRDRMSWHSGWR